MKNDFLKNLLKKKYDKMLLSKKIIYFFHKMLICGRAA